MSKDSKKNEVVTVEESTDNNDFYKVCKICGMTLKQVKDELKDLLKNDNPRVTLYDTIPGEVHVTVEAVSTDNDTAKKLGKPVVKEIKNRLGLNIYATDKDVSLAQSVIDLLTTNSLCIATAESCTGGMVASSLIDVPGASEVYKEGFVTYSNKAKRSRLGVKKSTLVKYGAVSEETAKEMAKGCAAISKANVSIATTGIAGPDGGTEDKPVGLVYVGCSVCGKTKVNKYNFEGDRMDVRRQATTAALSLLRMCVLEYYSEKNFS